MVQFLVDLFADDVWPLIWVLALVEIILIIAMVSTGRGKFLFWIAAVAAFAGILLIVEWFWVTARERVSSALDDMARAAREEDTDRLISHLSPQCHFGGLNRSGIQQVAEATLRLVDLNKVSLGDRRIELLPSRREATASFLAVATGKRSTTPFNSYPTRWRLTFQQSQAGEWKVVEIERFEPFGERRGAIPPPSHPGQPLDR
jgi:ketosteroid isomerase-like protein